MQFGSSRFIAAAVLCITLFVTQANAQFAALDTSAGKTSSTGVIVAVANNVPANGVVNVTSFPYFTTATRTQSSTTGQFFPNFSQTGFGGDLLNSSIGDANATITTPTTLFFTSPSGAAYSIHGLAGSSLGATFSFELKDLTAGTTLYSFSKTSTGPMTLDSSGGPVNSFFTKGHSFSLVTQFQTGSGALSPPPQTSFNEQYEIDFSQAPEPTAAMLVSLLAIPWMMRHRRGRVLAN